MTGLSDRVRFGRVAAWIADVIGTLGGRAVLGKIPEKLFRRIVSALILVLGVMMLVT